MKKKTIIAAVKVLSVLILILLSPVWARYPGGYWMLLIGIVVVAICISIIIDIIKEVWTIIKQRKSLSKSSFLKLTVLLIGTLVLVTIPTDLEDKFFGRKTFKAYYEGSQGGATFVLRDPDGFEVHHTGFFFNDEYCIGKFTRISDTLFLKYNRDTSFLLGEKVLIDYNDMMIKRIIGDSVVNSEPHFYFIDKEE